MKLPGRYIAWLDDLLVASGREANEDEVARMLRFMSIDAVVARRWAREYVAQRELADNPLDGKEPREGNHEAGRSAEV